MEDPRILVLALVIVVYGLLSRRLNGWWISMPVAMLTAGLLLGPVVLDQVDFGAQSELVKVVAEITLALLLFRDAVRIDLRQLRSDFAIPLRLLGIGLPMMLVVGTAVAYGMFPALGLAGAALLATMIAPTDAALGEAVVSDKRLPPSVRQGLNVESGLNDGLTVPFFIVLADLAITASGLAPVVLIEEMARQIGFGVFAGVLFGIVGGLSVRWARSRHAAYDAWVRIATLAIAVACYVSAAALGGSGFIGAFVGGVVFGLASHVRGAEVMAFTGYMGSLFDSLSFLLLGIVLVPVAFDVVTWPMLLYAVLSLVAIRTLSVAVALVGSKARPQTVLFMGWFGPRGLASVVFCVLLLDTQVPGKESIVAAAVVAIMLSVFAHGFTAQPFTARYAAWFTRESAEASMPMEQAGAPDVGLRLEQHGKLVSSAGGDSRRAG